MTSRSALLSGWRLHDNVSTPYSADCGLMKVDVGLSLYSSFCSCTCVMGAVAYAGILCFPVQELMQYNQYEFVNQHSGAKKASLILRAAPVCHYKLGRRAANAPVLYTVSLNLNELSKAAKITLFQEHPPSLVRVHSPHQFRMTRELRKQELWSSQA